MYKIIKAKDLTSIAWRGGTSTQLYIYPETGDYASRNFLARISIADTRDDSRSQFTALPGVDRFISPLEGVIQLEHEDHYNIDLQPFEIDRFQGSWLTFSSGKFRDFNLMLQGAMGDLYFKEIQGDMTLHLQEALRFSFLYVIEGCLELDQKIKLEQGELLIAEHNKLDIHSSSCKIFYGFVKEWDKNS